MTKICLLQPELSVGKPDVQKTYYREEWNKWKEICQETLSEGKIKYE